MNVNRRELPRIHKLLFTRQFLPLHFQLIETLLFPKLLKLNLNQVPYHLIILPHQHLLPQKLNPLEVQHDLLFLEKA
jgi:hypothetical protein